MPAEYFYKGCGKKLKVRLQPITYLNTAADFEKIIFDDNEHQKPTLKMKLGDYIQAVKIRQNKLRNSRKWENN